MFNRDYFGQVLEGDRSSVTMLFCRIANDPRHCSIELVEAGPIEHRMFDRWSMGLAERSETAEQINQKFGLVTGFNPSALSGRDFVNYVLEMVSQEDQLISTS